MQRHILPKQKQEKKIFRIRGSSTSTDFEPTDFHKISSMAEHSATKKFFQNVESKMCFLAELQALKRKFNSHLCIYTF